MQNNFNLNTAGYDLYEITRDEWILHVKNGPIFSGSLKKVGLHAVAHMGFKPEELEVAVIEMNRNGHNGAHFGMYKGFIFSFSKEFKNDQKAS